MPSEYSCHWDNGLWRVSVPSGVTASLNGSVLTVQNHTGVARDIHVTTYSGGDWGRPQRYVSGMNRNSWGGSPRFMEVKHERDEARRVAESLLEAIRMYGTPDFPHQLPRLPWVASNKINERSDDGI